MAATGELALVLLSYPVQTASPTTSGSPSLLSKHGERTLHLPSLALLLFGNDFYVFVIDVVLTQEAVNTSIHQVNGCRERREKNIMQQPGMAK